MKVVTVILFLFVSLCAFAQDEEVQARMEEVENNLIPYVPVQGFAGWNLLDRMKYYGVPGLSVAVIRNYKIDWAKGYGLADTLTKSPVTAQTLFSAGSISKFLMAATALKLVEEGKLSLDSPINHYLTSWQIEDNEFTRKTPVTLRMLLSHLAGTSQTSYFGFTPAKKPLPTIVDILNGAAVAETRKVVVNSEPGKEFRYSGGGSMIAQMALMDVSRQTFEALTQTILFDKLGMKQSTFEQPLPARFAKQASWAYSQASWFQGMPYVYPQQAAAGLYTTPSDLARFFIDIQKSVAGQGTVLSEAMVQQMLIPQVNVSDGGYREQMGIGPFLIQRTDNKNPNGVYFEFTGVNAGFLAYGIASIQGGNGVIVMLNSGDDQNGIGTEIRRAVAKVYGWTNFLPEEVKPVALSSAELDAFTGRYRMGTDEVVYLLREKNYLVEKINEGRNIYCFPVGRDSLVFTDYNIKGGVSRNEKGDVLSLQTAYQSKPMPRMQDDELTPGESLRAKRYEEAKKGYAEMNLNEYQITYLAYDLLYKKPFDSSAMKTVLEVAAQQHPNSSIVFSRWGDYYLKVNNRDEAIASYRKAATIDPTDKTIKAALQKLGR